MDAGKWRSMASVCRTNPEHPDAKAWPWLVDVPFGCLDAYIAERVIAAAERKEAATV